MRTELQVAVVFGGRSSEHGISCVTAGSVLAAIDRVKYDVIPIGITASGRWVLVADEPERLVIAEGRLPAVDDAAPSVFLAADPTIRRLMLSEAGEVWRDFGAIDLVFPLLHGAYGEDGSIQGLLELAGLPYVGSSVLASAASMDKEYMKRILTSFGLPVVPHVVIRPREWGRQREVILERVASLGWPLFVKPARSGSSMGIVKVAKATDLERAFDIARMHDPKVIVEAAIAGREIECGVLELRPDEPPRASVPAEVHVGGDSEFYDFQAKYLDSVTKFDVPAGLDAGTLADARRLALAAFDAMSCEGLARVDLFLSDEGTLLVSEINTMPGFTPSSMFPAMWQASGLSYPALVDTLITTALHRSPGLR